MESIAPPLQCLLDVKSDLESGKSVKASIIRYVERRKDSFSKAMAQWILTIEHGIHLNHQIMQHTSVYRSTLIEILKVGLEGQTIIPQLEELEKEIISACQDEIDEELQTLPLKMLIPLLLFQFPAFLLILLGPMFLKLLNEIG